MSFSVPGPTKDTHYLWSSCQLMLFSDMTVSQTCLVFTTLTVLNAGQVFCMMLFHWNLSGVLIGVCVWEREGQSPTWSVISSHSIESIQSTLFLTIDVDPDYLVEIVFVRFLSIEVALFRLPFPFQTVHFGTHRKAQPKPKEWALPLLFQREYAHSLFEILLHGSTVSSPPCIHVCSHVFMQEWMFLSYFGL